MKKLNKLFAILFAVLGVSATAKADTSILKESEGWQKITEIPTNLTDYYYALVDNSNDLMLTMAVGANQGSSYYTMYYKSSVNPLQNKAALWTIEGTNYTFRNTEYTKFALQTEWGAAWHYRTHDQANACEWTATIPTYSLSEACWTIQNGKYPDSGYLGPWSDTVQDGAEVACNKTGDAIGKFQIYAIHKTYCVDVLAPNATNANTVDMTVMMANRDAALPVVGLGGWTTANTITRNTNNGYDGKGGFFEFCNWNASSWEGSMTQTITSLPNGKYIVKAAGQASPTDVVLTLTANGVSTNLNCIGAEGGSISEDGTEVTLGSGVAGWQYMTVECVVANGELTITASSTGTAQYRWANIDNFTITYCGKDLTTYENALSSKIEVAKAIDKTKLNTYTSDYLANKITAAENALSDASRTVESLENQVAILDAAINLANGVIPIYSSINELISLCETYAAESYSNVETTDIRTTFTSAISLAKNDANDAESLEALNAVYNTLEAARQEFITVAYPTTGNSFDVTYKILNAEVTSKDNWETNANLASNVDYTGAPDVYALDRWDGGSTNGTAVYAKQTINNLSDGVYTLTAMARGNGADMYYVYATTNNVEYKEVVIGGGETGNPWGLVTVSNIVVVNGGSMELGLKGTNNNTWFSVDNFKLYRSYDATTAQNTVTSLVAEANSLTGEVMNADIADALTEAINSADVTSDDPFELGNMASALNTAIANAEASIAAYEAISAYIAKANKIDVSIAADYQTAYDDGTLESAETVFQKLEVATYNYVMTNFTYPVALSDTWNSKGTNTQAATFNNEHWSGTTREYKNQDDSNGQGWNAQAWSIDFDQSVTLPAGDYVFKVAGRKSAGTTLELVVTMGETELGTVNDFPSSNNTIGINKAGAASFDPEDPAGFANNGAGYGWQWRYVKFRLDAEATVKVAVHAETNAAHNWVSFGDYTLQMTEETYLEANQGALDAPTAEANALVDTKPMGAAENTALRDALLLPVTTGAELLAKIEALETAVANANAWVAAYNEAKAPLVAALERFETDYNDAENGALDYMAKSRWATAISMAQAAADAKDVTDSYEGFEEATANLVAALDAATVSVGEYAGLKAAIAEANAYYNGGNWGDQPFQRPTSVKETLNTTTAQATYDAAEADGEDVTSVTEALNNAVDAIVLNAPEDGQRFYIKVATEGHGKLGNAVLATLGATGENNPTGYGLNANNAVKGHLAQAFTITQVEGSNLYNISIVRPEGTVYLTYGSLNGSAANWKNQQIQATTDPEKKGEFKIEATTKEGVLKILNTVDNNYLDCQDGGSIYTDTGIEAEEFNFDPASEHTVTLTISAAEWATLILPFADALPEGVKAYSCAEAAGENLTLVEAESIDANTPYLVSGAEGTYTFTGYGMADKDAYTKGLFTGTYVDYQTTAGNNTYVLQNGAEGVAFYLVGEDAQPMVKAYRCYMTYAATEGAPVFRIGKGTTSIDNVQLTNDNVVIYDLMGRKVNTMVKGGMYIVNGKKVVIK